MRRVCRFYRYVLDVNNSIDVFGLIIQNWTKNEVLGRTIYQRDNLFDVKKLSR